jgi:hypothetical protein
LLRELGEMDEAGELDDLRSAADAFSVTGSAP